LLKKILFIISIISYALSSTNTYTDSIKQKKIYPIGKKVFTKKCNQNINLSSYSSITKLQTALKNTICKPLKPKQLEYAAIYLWDVKRVGKKSKDRGKIIVSKDEKCPVCGMFVYKYPRWASQIFYTKHETTHHYSFDGVKDMMKYYFDNDKSIISKIVVTDYYTQKAIDATKAYYVIGSTVYGPMGHELIPFVDLKSAKVFKKDHDGVEIIEFDHITKHGVYKLDE